MKAPIRRLAAVAVIASLAALTTACGSSTAPTTTPESSAASAGHAPGPPGLDWTTANVERPAGMDATPPSISPVSSGGGLGHPGHFSGQGNPYDLAAVGDRLIAVGYTFPDFHAVAWSTTDRHTWSLADIDPGTNDAFAQAIAAGLPDGATAGRVAVVGRIGSDAAAWTSADGVSWTRAAGGADFEEAPETRMTAVVAGPHGFVAGGWAGISNQPGRARFWTSTDGTTWQRAPDTPSMADGRVTGLLVTAKGFLAVGTTGPVGHETGSAVWRSADGSSWDRVDDPDLRAGTMASVSTGGLIGGKGIVAVGSRLDAAAARVWLSTDGSAWQVVEDQGSLAFHGLKITMSDVTRSPGGQLVAVGWFLFGTQYGQGTAWTSDDGGLDWTRMPDEAVFGQGEPQAVIADGPGYVATGTVGAPDNYIPTVWLSPSDR